MNRFKQCRHTPFLLETDNVAFGCYEDMYTAKTIGRARLEQRLIKRYVVRDLDGNIMDES